jgi:xanthine dehydrogenase accessory factor
MNHWKETAEILSRLIELEATGQRAALATVVDIVGSAYRRPGAKLLIEDGGGTMGSVSGGCLEADVREVAQAVVASGVPSLRHYNTGDEDPVWGLGLGCNGLVDVFVQPATEGPLAALSGRLRQLLAGDSALALATVVADAEPPELGRVLAVVEAAPEAAREAPARAAGKVPGEAPREASAGAEGRELEMPGAAGRAPAAPELVHGSLGTPELDRQVVARIRSLLASGRSGVQTIAGRRVFVEALPPPRHLLICGAGDDARPLVAYADDAGFRVTLLDHRPALLAAEWFPQAARRVVARPEDPDLELPPAARSLAVVKTHSLAHDREWVRRLLAAGLPYVGVLGPRGRTDNILRSIAAGDHADRRDPAEPADRGDPADRRAGGAGLGGGERDRVFGPVGLDLGADGPRQVALSIVAELLAFTAGREARHLSARREAIHAG